jgi:predicted ABC-type ATPase
MPKPAPKVIVIGGPNGAGKSTCAPILLRDRIHLLEFVNPDSIAIGLSAFQPNTVAMQAGRIMLSRLRNLAKARVDFAFESTLSGKGYATFLSKLLAAGYEFHLLYIWLQSAEIAVQRVRERVRLGGHDVPEDQIRRRYVRSRLNFFGLYLPLATSWAVFDNSLPPPISIAVGGRDHETVVQCSDAWVPFVKGGP